MPKFIIIDITYSERFYISSVFSNRGVISQINTSNRKEDAYSYTEEQATAELKKLQEDNSPSKYIMEGV